MSRAAAFAVLLVAIVVIVGAVILLAPSKNDDSKSGGDGPNPPVVDSDTPAVDPDPPVVTSDEYSITYVLNGGTLAEDAPSSYTAGRYMDLPVAVNEDKFFEGWYSDESCTIPVGAILESDKGDKTLYASWTDNLVGTGFKMKIEGTADSFLFKKQYSGTMSWSYLAYDDGAYYIQRDTDLTVRTFSFTRGDNIKDTDYYWTDEPSDVEYFYKGNETITGNYFGRSGSFICEVWESEDDKQYIYRSNCPLRIESDEGGIVLVYTFDSEISFTPVTEFQPTVYADYGIAVADPQTAHIGREYTLTASGTEFAGWYIDGQLATTSFTLTDSRATPDKVYEARSTTDYLVYESSTLYFADYNLQSPVTVEAEDGSRYSFEKGVQFNTDGYFLLIDSREPVHCVLRLYKEKTETFSVTWSYNNRSYSMSFEMKYSDVYPYSENGKDRSKYQTYADVSPYFTTTDPYVKLACSKLLEYRGTMDDREFASFVMRFVQTIPYLYDENSRGAYEFWKYPAETFWDGGGDCEDSSILYATLMKAMGYDTALIVYRDHAMASIHFSDEKYNYGDNVATINGKKYVLVETTGTGITWSDRDGYQLGDVFDFDYAPSNIRKTFVVGATS